MTDEFSPTGRLIQQAEQSFRYGAFNNGIDSLKEALSYEPDNGFLHSFLSYGLIQQKRLAAALHEAQLGLQLDPDSAYAHYALGQALLVKLKYRQALQHVDTAVSLDPDNPDFLLAQSRILMALKDKKTAEQVLERALALAPDSCDVLAEYGDFMFADNNINRAFELYDEALSIEPQHMDALIGMGNVLLKKGDINEAREHAIWVLQQSANYPPALLLLTKIKAKSNPFLGLWWRLNSWLVSGSTTRTIILLMSGFIMFRLGAIMLEENDHKSLAELVSNLWLGIVIYTWVGPVWFHKQLEKETQTVTLNKDF